MFIPFFFYDSCEMKTGWLEEDGNWYYLNQDGAVQTGTSTICDIDYNFNSSGQLIPNHEGNDEGGLIEDL